MKADEGPCPFGPAMEILFARWTSQVLWALSEHGPLRFTELRALVPGVTPKVLTERLRKLERDGLVTRTYHTEMPPRVEYKITDLAASLGPAFRELSGWTQKHLQEVHSARRRFDDRD